MQLVIAEKPSVAQSIAAVLGANQRKNGYLEGNGYQVSWCLGHLAELANAERYDEKYAKWRYDDLPILPQQWQYALRPDKADQFKLLKKLMNSPEVDTVVNACDAGREGEAIFRTVYALAECRKPMKRLWISSMEDSAIRDGFATLRPGAEYDGLHKAAVCRSEADWLVGINATRLFSVLYRKTLNIGRVMSPTLALIVQREAEIDAFKPEAFYTVELKLPGFSATGERLNAITEAENRCRGCTATDAIVKNVECKDKTEKPPALYDLTTLQRDANRLLGYTAQQTLDYLQNLYEKKLCTYPRTDSRYLTSDMAAGLPALAADVGGAKATVNPAQVINDKKVSDHHAILPTHNVASADLAGLPTGERAVLELLMRRLLCALGQPHEYAETVATLDCGGHSYTAKGKVVKCLGWKATERAQDDESMIDKPLPVLVEEQSLSVTSAAVKDGKTTSPKHFTEDTLLSAMEAAGAKDMPEDAERKGLGTPATRAGILEKLVSTGFVERRKVKKAVQLIPTNDAVALITVLPEQLQSPLLTAEWEYRLKEIEHGELSAEVFMADISDMVKELVSTYQVISGAEVLFPSNKPVIGKCPRCGGNVTESKQGFFCENKPCKFALWKNSAFFTVKKKQLTKAIAADLLANRPVALKGCFSEKTGKTYDTTIYLSDDGQRVNYKMEFSNKGGEKNESQPCRT